MADTFKTESTGPDRRPSSADEQKKAGDWLTTFSEESNKALAKRAAEKQQQPPPDEGAVIEVLARKSHTEYDKVRSKVAESLGIRVGTLDDKVEALRGERETEGQSQPKHWEVVPSTEAVDGAALLDSLRALFRRYIMLPPWADIALPLWVLHDWTYNACEISPILCLTSPTKRCGKTSVMILLTYLTRRSDLASNISKASIYRYIEAEHPTLLIDEGDTFLTEDDEMRGILDSGHTKAAANVVRTVEERGGNFVTRRFSTWAPKAIALIKKLADTLDDRSVTLCLMRKPKGAQVERLRKRDTAEFATLRSQSCRWAADYELKLIDADPMVPDALHDRAADNWRPLLAIADLAGGRWPELARKAACELTGAEDDGALNVTLLKGLRTAFGADNEMRSVDLVTALVADPEAPWGEYNRGKPLTQRQLAKMLGQFGVISVTVHPPELSHGKGYKRVDLEPLWESYCPLPPGQNDPSDQIPHFQACERANVDDTGITDDFSSVREPLPHGSKTGNLAANHAGLHACTDKKGERSGGSF
jgi:putative DNA primase/helicase